MTNKEKNLSKNFLKKVEVMMGSHRTVCFLIVTIHEGLLFKIEEYMF